MFIHFISILVWIDFSPGLWLLVGVLCVIFWRYWAHVWLLWGDGTILATLFSVNASCVWYGHVWVDLLMPSKLMFWLLFFIPFLPPYVFLHIQPFFLAQLLLQLYLQFLSWHYRLLFHNIVSEFQSGLRLFSTVITSCDVHIFNHFMKRDICFLLGAMLNGLIYKRLQERKRFINSEIVILDKPFSLGLKQKILFTSLLDFKIPRWRILFEYPIYKLNIIETNWSS